MFTELVAVSRAGPSECVSSMIAWWKASSSLPSDRALLSFEIAAGSSMPIIAFIWLPGDNSCSLVVESMLSVGFKWRLSPGESPLEDPLNPPPCELPRCIDTSESESSAADSVDRFDSCEDSAEVAMASALPVDSGDDVDLDELGVSVLEEVSAELSRVESLAGVFVTGEELDELEPALLAEGEDAVAVDGSSLLPSVDGVIPVDEPLTGLVVDDGVFVWEPLETAPVGLSGALAAGELDGSVLAVPGGVFIAGSVALTVLEGVFAVGSVVVAAVPVGVSADDVGFDGDVVGVSASKGVVGMGTSAVGISTEVPGAVDGSVGIVVGVSASSGIVTSGVSTVGFPAEAPGVVGASVDEGVCGLKVTGDEVATAPPATGVSAVGPGTAAVGDSTEGSGGTVAIATVDAGAPEAVVGDGGSARIGMSEKEPAVDGVGAVGVDPVDADGVDGAGAVAVGCVDAVGDSVTGEVVAVGFPAAGVSAAGVEVAVGGAASVGAVVGVSARIGTSSGNPSIVGAVVATGAVVVGFAKLVAEGVAVSAGMVVTGAVEVDAVGVAVAGDVGVVGVVTEGLVEG
ncbi:hypothetical protein L914_06711 [Phytophthora nicotianae]|uniref:Uncharacterized protein n=1 Tax=Phytophthora nicotianae TaxID=4792 RepID=W2NLK0_PHYNI|nr:hypothetical protein L914_06711 [Phytophthora nicotianae]